ncbi:MAG TPA: hypothetical protein VIK45_01460 [Candidatus Dormibacteraeota bacterium]
MTRVGDPLRTTVAVCAAGAIVALATGLALGRWQAGLVFGLGLLAGSSNGFLARGALRSELNFRFTSGVRLLALTALAVGAAALFDIRLILVALAGLALAQLVMAVAAGVWLVRSA